MYLTGFADEAADSIQDQIKATLELGWSYIESRKVNGQMIHDMPEAEFDAVCETLNGSGVSINCFGSAITNWQHSIEDDFQITLDEVNRTIPRMKKLGVKLIRIMSYAVLKDKGPSDQMREERFRRLNVIVPMFLEAGITPVHENCMNYGGMGWPYTLDLIANVPGMKLVFDTGNPVFSLDRYKGDGSYTDAWEFYRHVKEHIAYVHIKDGKMNGDKTVFMFAGEGDGHVKKIVKDLLDNGYQGGISMEPHLAVVFHDAAQEGDDAAKAKIRYENYVEYGRRFEALLKEIGHGDKINSTKP